MASKTFDDVKKDIANKIFAPIYLFQGEESYYIDELSNLFEASVLSEDEKEFNQTILYGRDCESLTLVSNLKRYPMMSNYQLVVLREAQEMKGGLNSKSEEKSDSKKDQKTEPLLAYLENPLRSTIFIICYKYKTLDKRSKIYKTIEKNGIVFESKKLYENKIPEWIEKYLAVKKIKIEPKASQLMADYLGTDLSRIANECDKLCISTQAGETISLHKIEINIGISKEFNTFELQDAIGKRDILKANRIVNYFKANPKVSPVPATIALLYSYFTKVMTYHSLNDQSPSNVASALGINPFFVNQYSLAAKNYSSIKLQDIIGYLHETDLRFKGVNSTSADQDDLLRELIYKILH